MLEWMVTGSAMILLVLVLRRLVRDRAGPRLRYALWGLALLRLLVPGTLWESKASVMTPVAAREEYQAIERIPRYVRTRPDGWVEIGHANGRTSIPEAKAENGEPVVYGWPERSEVPNLEALRKQVDLRDAFLTAWLAGAVLTGAFLLAVNLKFSHNLKKNRRAVKPYRGRWVFLAEGLATPCLFGLFRPGIYLTAGLGEDEEEHVLAHEYTHFRQGDHVWAALRGACLALHWYNPLAWLAAVLSRRDCELSCDEGAVRLLGEERRADYGRTLVGLVARRTTAADLACCATTMTGGKSALKERVALLVKRPRTTAAMAFAAAAACAVFALCTFTGAAETEGPDAPAEPVRTEQEPADAPAPEEEPAGLPADAVLLDIPEDLPTEPMDLSRPAEEQGEWLLLARAPYTDAALYRRADDARHVYLRLTNQCFQRFDRDLTGMELLPAMDLWDGEGDLTVQVLYRRYEGTYFNGRTYEPGIVADMALYDWNEDGKYWEEKHAGGQPILRLTEDLPAVTGDLPAIEDLPTEFLTDVPGAYQEPLQLLARLEDGVAIYADRRDGSHGLIRYGDYLQWVPEPFDLDAARFEDLDGDGARELAVAYTLGRGTGRYQRGLTVYEWDGGRGWTGYSAGLERDVIRDFNAGCTLALYPEDGRAAVEYRGESADVDMAARFGNRALWADAGVACELREEMYRYSLESGLLTLTIGGELRPAGYEPTACYAFEYVCNVYYEADGTFRATWSRLDTDFRWSPRVDESRLTPVFREILRDFIRECRELQGGGDADISGNHFAICDVNGDGKDELITQLNATIMAGQSECVYDGDGNELLRVFPDTAYYGGGAVMAGWSHNQGAAGDRLWPYTLFQYDADTGKYVRLVSVDGWDKSLRDAYFSWDGSFIPFPDGVDGDGDGFVYYLLAEEGGYAPVYGEPMDNADYARWLARNVTGDPVDVRYIRLTENNIALVQ